MAKDLEKEARHFYVCPVNKQRYEALFTPNEEGGLDIKCKCGETHYIPPAGETVSTRGSFID